MNAYALIENANENKTLIIKNGVLMKGEEKRDIMSLFQNVYSKIKDEYLERKYIKFFPKEKLCYYSIITGDEDKYGRKMIAYFIWDEKCEEDNIKKTADFLNIDYKKMLNDWNDYRKKSKKILLATAIVLIGLTIAYLNLNSQK